MSTCNKIKAHGQLRTTKSTQPLYVQGRGRANNESSKQVESELRTKVQELESEVRTLKVKLDELRKAKNTTLIKHEKEFITTGK